MTNYCWGTLIRLLVRYVMTGSKFHVFSMSDYLLTVAYNLDVQERAVQGASNISREAYYKHR